MAKHTKALTRTTISLEAEHGGNADSDGTCFRDTLPASDGEDERLEQVSVAELRRALEFLESKRTIYLLLHDLEELSCEDIAKLLGETPVIVKGRCQMARRHLAAIVKRLRELEEIPWKQQLDKLCKLSGAHVQAWKFFFSVGLSVTEVMRRMREQRPVVIKLLRKAFAVLR